VIRDEFDATGQIMLEYLAEMRKEECEILLVLRENAAEVTGKRENRTT
jgi:hypothetical protein